ncbi:MAG TPA: hypothetical protein P5246_06270, partial [Candidatus Omnitrophota bacterium]|nr:hypothetical protein [Candidatus Omnitrophota bacterium]
MIRKYLPFILFVLVFCCLFFMFYKPVRIVEDAGWHLSTGRWISENKSVPREDVFSASEESRVPWTVMHWLGSFIYYQLFQMGGFALLKWVKAILLMGPCLLFFFFGYRRIPGSVLALILYLMSFGLVGYDHVRPLLFNFVFIAAFLAVLFHFERNGERKVLFLLPALSMLWSNLHLGGFVYGNTLFFAFFLAHAATYADLKISHGPDSQARAVLQKTKILFITWMLFLVSFLVNPYGLDGMVYPYKVFLLPRFMNFYQFGSFIVEMAPPVYLLSIWGWWFYLLFFLTIASIAVCPRNRQSSMIVFAAGLMFYLYARRGSGFFVIVCAFIIAKSALEAGFVQKWSNFQQRRHVDALIGCVLAAVCAVQIFNKVNERVFFEGSFKRAITLDINPHDPSEAIDFLEARGMEGVVLTTDVLGGSVMWKSYPRLRPFIDGRLINQELFSLYQQALNDPVRNMPVLSRLFNCRVVLLDASMRSSYRLLDYLNASSEWELVFLDGSFVVFTRKGSIVLNEGEAPFQDRLRAETVSEEDISYLKSLVFKKDRNSLANYLEAAPSYIDLHEEGVVL